MAKLSQAQEPTMEEILASIRRIISDEDQAASPPGEPQADVAVAAPEVLFAVPASEPTLRPDEFPAAFASAVQPAVPQSFEPPAPQEHLPAIEEPAAQPLAEPFFPRAFEPPVPSRIVPPDEMPAGRALLSPAADSAVTAAFNNLAGTLLSNQARTLEDLVKDMMRPMLKSWLDANLPQLVEKLVRDEIERVSRGR